MPLLGCPSNRPHALRFVLRDAASVQERDAKVPLGSEISLLRREFEPFDGLSFAFEDAVSFPVAHCELQLRLRIAGVRSGEELRQAVAAVVVSMVRRSVVPAQEGTRSSLQALARRLLCNCISAGAQPNCERWMREL